jgi:hypothetical protein
MTMPSRLGAVLCSFLLLISGGLEGVNGNRVSPAQKHYNYRSPFRYVIVSNEIIDGRGNPKDAFRYVEVLLDEKAFNEETLRELFKLLSKRFPKPKSMDVSVSTNLEQVDTPEEREAGKISEAPANPTLDRYPSALLIRQDDNELFRYTPNTPSTKMKTVVIKGRDPQERKPPTKR